MDATWIIAVFVLTDDLMALLEHRSHRLCQVPDAEVIIVAVVAARYFNNHHERALQVLAQLHYLSGSLSVSRFNRRLHALGDWLRYIAETLGELSAPGNVLRHR